MARSPLFIFLNSLHFPSSYSLTYYVFQPVILFLNLIFNWSIAIWIQVNCIWGNNLAGDEEQSLSLRQNLASELNGAVHLLCDLVQVA